MDLKSLLPLVLAILLFLCLKIIDPNLLMHSLSGPFGPPELLLVGFFEI